jgi:Hypervirulence associated proteins TUDOR domain
MSDKNKQDEPAVGDEVTWRSHGSSVSGTVEEKITERTEESGRTVNASPEDPQYRVRSDKSSKSAVHKPSALHKKGRHD